MGYEEKEAAKEQKDRGMSSKERERGWGRKGDEISSPPSPMATEWVEGRGCPSGPVNQQFTAESCAATVALVTPDAQSFNIQPFLLLLFFSLLQLSSLCLSVLLLTSPYQNLMLNVHIRIKMNDSTMLPKPERRAAETKKTTSPIALFSVFLVAMGTGTL